MVKCGKCTLKLKYCECKAKVKEFEGYKFDEEGFSELFHKLDINKDGRIDVEELSEGLKRLGIAQVPGQAEVPTWLAPELQFVFYNFCLYILQFY